MCYYVSSPYLFLFGDDRVHGIREQRILQVDLVRFRLGAWASWRKCYKILLEFYYAFGLSCKSYIMRFEHFI